VIDRAAVDRFKEAVAEAESSGGEVLAGGQTLEDGDFARGNFVEPTVVTAPLDSWVWDRELFVPFVAVAKVSDLDQGLELANDTPFGPGSPPGSSPGTTKRSIAGSTESRPGSPT
jgi:acyl-CoA reductase-like NAD-dependent aldehyde dehydrogenase